MTDKAAELADAASKATSNVTESAAAAAAGLTSAVSGATSSVTDTLSGLGSGVSSNVANLKSSLGQGVSSVTSQVSVCCVTDVVGVPGSECCRSYWWQSAMYVCVWGGGKWGCGQDSAEQQHAAVSQSGMQ